MVDEFSVLKRYQKHRSAEELSDDYENDLVGYESERESLLRRKAMALRKDDIRKRKRELQRLEHPREYEFRRGLSRAGSRFSGFAGSVIKEGVRSYGQTKRTLERVRPSKSFRAYRGSVGAGGSLINPDGGNTSFSEAIATNTWSAPGSSLMERDFFGIPEAKNYYGELNPTVKSKKLLNNYY